MRKNSKQHFLTLIIGLMLYGLCQEDVFLPLIASIILTVSYLRSLIGFPVKDTLPKLSWPAVALISILLGYFWRSWIPDPSNASSLLPMVIGPLQSATIFASLYAWFRPSLKKRSFALNFLSWCTVALSVNITFNAITLSVFLLYCAVTLLFVFLKTFRKPDGKTIKQPFKSKLIQIFLICLFVLMSAGTFSTIVVGLRVTDETFSTMLSDYIISLRQHHFIGLNAFIRIDGPGPKGRDTRPVLEIKRFIQGTLYLKTQVFHNHINGVWEPPVTKEKKPLTNIIEPSADAQELLMFRNIDAVIPSPQSVSAMRSGNTTFHKDSYGVITADSKKRMRKITFIPSKEKLTQTDPDYKLTLLSHKLRTGLKPHLDSIAGQTQNPVQIARLIESYFHRHFEYSLDIDFTADDDGILRMLKDKQPAYCTYFASAMALMLRERNIPSRLVVGFLAQENSRDDEFYIVRMRDAHAWVEALLPIGNTKQWIRFDPTPPASFEDIFDRNKQTLANRIYLKLLRFRNHLATLNRDAVYGLWIGVLLLVILLMNTKKFLIKIRSWKNKNNTKKLIDQKNKEEYCLKSYENFLSHIEKEFKMKHLPNETNAQLIDHIRRQKNTSPQKIERIKKFIDQYEKARFGKKDIPDLEESLNILISDKA